MWTALPLLLPNHPGSDRLLGPGRVGTGATRLPASIDTTGGE
jgi:hypothetical protein